MKKIFINKIVVLLFISMCFNTYSQKLSLNELHTFSSNKNWETTNKYLISKGWDYNNSEVGDDLNYNVITWAYNKTGYDTERAASWFHIYSYEGLPNKVLYRFRKKEYYTSILQQIHSSGYKLKGEEIRDKAVVATYSNQNYTLEINYERVEDDDYSYDGSYTVYNVVVVKKGGVYDPDNGKKYEYDDEGNVIAEYFLKDGKPDGTINYFYPDGSISKTTQMKMGVENGLSTQYIYYPTESDSTSRLIGKYKGTVINDKKNGKWESTVIKNGVETVFSIVNYVDDSKEGNFRFIENDSVTFGQYKNNKIEGRFTVYKNVNNMLNTSHVETDSLKLTKIIIGNYSNNKREGRWKYFDLSGQLITEGTYQDSLKTGIWRNYYPKIIHQSGQIAEFSGKLYLEENYSFDQLNGPTIRYSVLDKIEVPCGYDSSKTCYDYEITYLSIITNYKDDELNGEYEFKNNKGKLIEKGKYKDGLQTGTWTVLSTSGILNSKEPTYEYGNFSYDKRQGEWKRYDDNNQLIAVCTYFDDALNGDHIQYFNNKPIIKRKFKNNDFIGYQELDDQQNPTLSYEIKDVNEFQYTCTKTEKNAEGTFIKTYSVSTTATDTLNYRNFKDDFESMPLNRKKLNGFYKHSNNGQQLVQEGNYTSGIKSGMWTLYFYDQNVKAVFKYDYSGKVYEENYLDLKKNEPFSGEFVFKPDDSEFIEERKIKDGVRNGATRYKDANDKTIKKESYKDGVLKE